MFKSTRRTRRHRNPQQSETQGEKPFFSKTNAPPVQAKEDPAFFQPKLTIGQPGDKYEQEADAVADTVVNGGGQQPVVQQKAISSVQRESLATPVEDEKLGTAEARMEKDKMIQEKPEIQRMGGEEEEPVQMMGEKEEEPVQMQEEEEEPVQMMGDKEEEPVQMQEEEEEVQMQEEEEEPVQMQEEEEEVQAKSDPAAPTRASSNLSQRIKSGAGKGRPLPAKPRSEMENAFGVDFSGVNVHSDAEAIGLNKELGAQAFTHGKDVYFNSGKFRPESADGKRLLAHELTHVVQQGESGKAHKIQRKVASPASLTAARFKRNSELQKALQDVKLIKKGAKGEHVSILQKALIDDGISLPIYGVDGDYGNETKKAVIIYQFKHGLSPDGIVGPQTMGHLDTNFATVVKTSRYDKWYQDQIKLYTKESAFPYHVAVMNVFYKSRNFHVIQILNDIKYKVWTFTGAVDLWKYHADGRLEYKDKSKSLRGNTDRKNKIIRLNQRMKPQEAAMVLYHEMNHVTSKEKDRLKQEVESRVVTEQFAIDNNMPETVKNYRTKDGKVNKAYIEQQIYGSKHYNPKDKSWMGRTYIGEKNIGPWIVPK